MSLLFIFFSKFTSNLVPIKYKPFELIIEETLISSKANSLKNAQQARKFKNSKSKTFLKLYNSEK
jgi:hypothetical protein